MKNSIIFLLSILVFISLLANTICNASEQVILKMAIYQPAAHPFTKYYRSKVSEVEKATKGRIQVKIYDSSVLLDSMDMLDGTDKGIADIGYLAPFTMAKTIPFLGLTDLPGIWRDNKGFNDTFDNGLTELYEQAYHEAGLMNVKVIGLSNIGFWYIAFTKKEVRVPDDMKGMKLMGTGPMHVKFIETCGGSGIYIEVGQRYEALERGIADGVTGFTSNFVGWKWMEVCKYLTDYPQSLGPMLVLINKHSLEKKVPGDLREIFLSTLKRIVIEHREVMAAETIQQHDVIMPKYMKYYKPTSEEEKLWRAIGKSLVSEWLSKTGPLGKKAMDIVLKYNER